MKQVYLHSSMAASGHSNRRSMSISYEAKIKDQQDQFPPAILSSLLLWKNRAQQTVAIHHFDNVERRHMERYNLEAEGNYKGEKQKKKETGQLLQELDQTVRILQRDMAVMKKMVSCISLKLGVSEPAVSEKSLERFFPRQPPGSLHRCGSAKVLKVAPFSVPSDSEPRASTGKAPFSVPFDPEPSVSVKGSRSHERGSRKQAKQPRDLQISDFGSVEHSSLDNSSPMSLPSSQSHSSTAPLFVPEKRCPVPRFSHVQEAPIVEKDRECVNFRMC